MIKNPRFGRKEPKIWKHVEKYPFRKLGISTLGVEKTLPIGWLDYWYNQKNTNSCVGFSTSRMMTYYNHSLYDAMWLYGRACAVDGDPSTSLIADNGTYIWAAMDILRREGHKPTTLLRNQMPVSYSHGIQSNYWCTTADEVRAAIAMDRPVVIGINWYQQFMNPVRKGLKYWIGSTSNWGSTIGGHAIMLYGASDNDQGFVLANSWGVGSFSRIWLPYSALERLLRENGEAAVALDR